MTEDSGTLATVASIIAAFGIAMLFFRIQRELQMAQQGELNWIPYADWLLVWATSLSLLLVILPLVITGGRSVFAIKLARASCSAVTIAVTGYIIGIFAHYRLIFGKNRKGPRENPEPAEKAIVILTGVLAATSFLVLFLIAKN